MFSIFAAVLSELQACCCTSRRAVSTDHCLTQLHSRAPLWLRFERQRQRGGETTLAKHEENKSQTTADPNNLMVRELSGGEMTPNMHENLWRPNGATRPGDSEHKLDQRTCVDGDYSGVASPHPEKQVMTLEDRFQQMFPFLSAFLWILWMCSGRLGRRHSQRLGGHHPLSQTVERLTVRENHQLAEVGAGHLLLPVLRRAVDSCILPDGILENIRAVSWVWGNSEDDPHRNTHHINRLNT